MTAQLPAKLAEVRKRYHKQQEKRDFTITHSRELTKKSKHAIHLLHEQNLSLANKKLQEVKELQETIRTQGDINQPSYKHATEEYVEAATLHAFIQEKELPLPEELLVDEETYYAGLCDVAGEVTRLATRAAIKRDEQFIKRSYELLQELQGELLQLTLRNNHLRKKADSVKYNVKKLEQLQYEYSLRRREK